MTTTTIRDLRNHFPKVKAAVEAEGEVIVTDNGKPKYRLTLYTPTPEGGKANTKDYMARMRKNQPRALGVAAAKSLNDENRGER